MHTTLNLAYEHNGRAVAIGRVRSPRMIREAARHAVSEKRREVVQLSRIDPGLGVIGEGELRAMRSTLTHLLPDLSSTPRHTLATVTGAR